MKLQWPGAPTKNIWVEVCLHTDVDIFTVMENSAQSQWRVKPLKIRTVFAGTGRPL